MQEFDPRRPQMRYAPRLLVCAVGCAALAFGWRVTTRPEIAAAHRPLDAAAVSALEHQAFAQAEAQPGFARPEKVAIRVLPGETFEDRDCWRRRSTSCGSASTRTDWPRRSPTWGSGGRICWPG